MHWHYHKVGQQIKRQSNNFCILLFQTRVMMLEALRCYPSGWSSALNPNNYVFFLFLYTTFHDSMIAVVVSNFNNYCRPHTRSRLFHSRMIPTFDMGRLWPQGFHVLVPAHTMPYRCSNPFYFFRQAAFIGMSMVMIQATQEMDSRVGEFR